MLLPKKQTAITHSVDLELEAAKFSQEANKIPDYPDVRTPDFMRGEDEQKEQFQSELQRGMKELGEDVKETIDDIHDVKEMLELAPEPPTGKISPFEAKETDEKEDKTKKTQEEAGKGKEKESSSEPDSSSSDDEKGSVKEFKAVEVKASEFGKVDKETKAEYKMMKSSPSGSTSDSDADKQDDKEVKSREKKRRKKSEKSSSSSSSCSDSENDEKAKDHKEKKRRSDKSSSSSSSDEDKKKRKPEIGTDSDRKSKKSSSSSSSDSSDEEKIVKDGFQAQKIMDKDSSRSDSKTEKMKKKTKEDKNARSSSSSSDSEEEKIKSDKEKPEKKKPDRRSSVSYQSSRDSEDNQDQDKEKDKKSSSSSSSSSEDEPGDLEKSGTSVKSEQKSEPEIEHTAGMVMTGGTTACFIDQSLKPEDVTDKIEKPESDTIIPEHDAQITSGQHIEGASDFDHQVAVGGVSKPEVDVTREESRDILPDEIKAECDDNSSSDNETMPQLESATLDKMESGREPGKKEVLVTSATAEETGAPGKVIQETSQKQKTGTYECLEASSSGEETGETGKMEEKEASPQEQEPGEAVYQVPGKLDSSDSSVKGTSPAGEEPHKVEPVASLTCDAVTWQQSLLLAFLLLFLHLLLFKHVIFIR